MELSDCDSVEGSSISERSLPTNWPIGCKIGSVTHYVSNLVWPPNISASAILGAAWSILRSQYENSSDVVFATNCHRGNEDSIARVRVQLKWDADVSDLLRQFETDDTDIPCMSESPRTMLKVLMNPDSSSSISFLRLMNNYTDWISNYEMYITCSAQQKGLWLSVCFQNKNTDNVQAQRIAFQFEHIVRQLCDPSTLQTSKLADIEPISNCDKQELWRWNSTVPDPINASIYELFAHRSKVQPDADALCSWDGQLTYLQLEEKVGMLEVWLRSCGFGLGSVVPFCFEKCAWTTIVLLAIAKMGAVFIALDPAQPKARLQTILRELKTDTILCRPKTLNLAASIADHCHILRQEVNDFMQRSPTGLDTRVDPSQIAYIVFTSGSTGVPKGLQISHSNLCSAAVYQAGSLGFNNESRSVDSSSYSFDAYIFNSFYTLFSGGCLCVPSDEERINDIAGTIRKFDINIAQLTPSVLKLIPYDSVPNLRTLILTGEKPNQDDLVPLLSRMCVTNAYGPSECTIMCSANVGIARTEDSQKIGRNLGCVIWLRDLVNESRLAPIGAVGEIMIEGPIVGQGYIQKNVTSTTAWLDSSPWLSQGPNGSGGRSGVVFKTGDLAYYNTDGTLTIVGRSDRQVKVHGQRVETGEVEYHIRQTLNKGDDCVVEVVSALSAEPELTCYLQLREPKTANEVAGHIKSTLVDILPRHMIPSLYLPIERIPLTASGKTDRRELMKWATLATEGDFVRGIQDSMQFEPRTPQEMKLQQLWMSVLRRNNRSTLASDNFFYNGGDSLAAMKLVEAVRKEGFSLTVATIFRYPQLSEMAARMEIKHREWENDLVREASFPLVDFGVNEQKELEVIASRCGIDVNSIEGIYPCSPMQESLLAITARRPGYFRTLEVINLPRDVDLDRLKSAWNRVIAASPIFRTRFVESADWGVLQVLVRDPLEWSALSSEEQFCAERARSCFNEPPVKFGIVSSPAKMTLYLTMHHSVYDAWTMNLLMKQVKKAYDGEALGTMIPYQKYIQYLSHADDKAADDFWTSTLADFNAPQFPTLPTHGYQPIAKGIYEHTILDIKMEVKKYTTSTLLRSAWALLVSQYTNSSDVCYGAVVSGRQAPMAGIECVAGPTVAAVPIRILVDWASSVDKFLENVQDHGTDMFQFEHVGMSRIRHLSPDADQACQFQSLLVVQPSLSEGDPENFFDLGNGNEDLSTFNTNALAVSCFPHPDNIRLQLSYDPVVVGDAQAQRIALQLEHNFRQLSAMINMDRSLKEVDLLSVADKKHIRSLNAVVPSAAHPSTTVLDIIGSKVFEQPYDVAIDAWDGTLTYEDLWAHSLQLASTLRSKYKVSTETLVPLCCEKSLWTAVAMLGVIQAGGVAVVMDPSQPEDRLRAIVTQTKSTFILTSDKYSNMAGHLTQQTAIVDQLCQTGSMDLPDPGLKGENGLFIIFTSGSTGTPKGICISHTNVCSAIEHQGQALGLSKHTRMMDFASYAFDLAWFNLLYTLSAGGCLCIPSDEDRKNNLPEAIQRFNANYIFLTPSLGRHLNSSTAPSLKDVNFGAEPVSHADISGWDEDVRIRIAYGPAEATVMSNIVTLGPNLPQELNTGPGIGMNCWITSCLQDSSLAPVGAVGELMLEGPLLGRGYLGDPEGTAAAFVRTPEWLANADPDLPSRGSVLYKTGDLVKYTTDGALVIVGRKDTMVKIRGQRVELEEVELHARRLFPDHTHLAAEVVRLSDREDPTLVLFMADKSPKDENLFSDMKSSLAKVLPKYMVPTALIRLDSLPMTISGKMDRKKLRQIGATMKMSDLFTDSSTQETSPRQPLEPLQIQLRQLWADVLGLSPSTIDLDTDFEKIGGDSLMAMRLSTKARSQGWSLSVVDIFEYPTLEDMARSISLDGQEDCD